MQIIVSGSIFSLDLKPYAEREKKLLQIKYHTFNLLLTTAGIKPGPPAQQASLLSITPLPLCCLALVKKLFLFPIATSYFQEQCCYLWRPIRFFNWIDKFFGQQ